jgi:oligopeptide/dipeptide ABC transporter ATP-binding protein
MESPLLELRDYRVHLPTQTGPRLVVDGVNLDIGPTEAVGLVGESGSGKSTTARSIIRLLPQGAIHGGDIVFDGRSILALTKRELRDLRANDVQMIFQDPRAHVNPVRRIGDYLTEALRTNDGLSRVEAEERVLELLNDVGVAHGRTRLHQYPHELSGGLLQRMMIAAALARAPRLLIADEPTTALDVTTQAEVLKLLRRLRLERHLAVLFITHDLELASAFCDRTVVMYAGRIVEDQKSDVLHQRPLHPYTAGLFGSRPSVANKAHRLAAIPGRPISAFEAPPEGCPFAPRCAWRADSCTRRTPPLREMAGGRVACDRVEEITELSRPVSGGVAT